MNHYEEPEQHAMVLLARHPDGSDEFYCQTCGRRMLIHWPPDYKKTVLEPGNDYAVHTGSKGGLTLGPSKIESTAELEDPLSADDLLDINQDDNIYEFEPDVQDEDDDPKEAERLAEWDAWLDQVGFNSWWEREL